MPRLRRVARLCSRTVSGTAYRFRHGSTLCSPTVEKILCRSPISQRSHVGNLRQTIQGKGVIHKRVETAGVYPLVRPRGVSAVAAAQPPQFSQPKIGCHSCSAGYRCKNLSQKLAIHFIHRTFHRVSGDNLVHKVDNFLYTPSQAAVYLGFSTTHCNIGCGKTTAA